MKKTISVVGVFTSLLLVVVLGIHGSTSKTADTELGLSKGSVFDVPAPEPIQRNVSEPGDEPLIPRGFPEQPPAIPHGIDEFLPILLQDNQCMDCHAVEEKVEGEATPIPRSHYVDLRNAPEEAGDEPVGARHLCLSCHASPGGNAPLVGNTFGE